MARRPVDTPAEPLPEADRIPGAPHPREAARVIGQDAAMRDFLRSAGTGRLHHAWLLAGPRGVGKATLAWAIARWLLADGAPGTLETDPDSALARRMRALSEPRLALVRRPFNEKTGRHSAEITVEEIRRLLGFFQMTATDGGRRVAIIDAADEMNPSAANALLKLLEEPPPGAVLLLVAHRPARLLPTIRSRCRLLRLAPLDPAAMAEVLAQAGAEVAPDEAEGLAALSGGSAGEALRLSGQDGLAVYGRLLALAASLPRLDRQAAARIAEAASARAQGDGDPFDLVVTLLDRLLSRLALAGLSGPPMPPVTEAEPAILARLSPHDHAARDWADAQARLGQQARAGRAVNLDAAALVMDMLTRLAQVPAAQGARM